MTLGTIHKVRTLQREGRVSKQKCEWKDEQPQYLNINCISVMMVMSKQHLNNMKS